MDLHGLVRGQVTAVNADVTCLLQQSVGNYTGDDGAQVPLYAPPREMPCQIQPMTFDELRLVDSINIQGVKRAIYLWGYWAGVVRPDQRGGDLVIFPDKTLWLAVLNIEAWPDWSKIAVVQQMKRRLIQTNEGSGFILAPGA